MKSINSLLKFLLTAFIIKYMSNKFENQNFFNLLNLLQNNAISEEDCESFVEALYHEYCKTKKQTSAELEFYCDEENVFGEDNSSKMGSYVDGVIKINKVNFKNTLCSENRSKRFVILLTLIHENRHFIQDQENFNQSEALNFASLGLKLFHSYVNVKGAVMKKYKEKISESPINHAIYSAMIQNEIESIINMRNEGYLLLPWEIDARDYTLREIKEISEYFPPFENLFINMLYQSGQVRNQFSSQFSIFDLLTDGEKYINVHNDILTDAQTEVQEFGSYKNKLLNLLKQNNITTKEQETDFVEKLYPYEFFDINKSRTSTKENGYGKQI